MFCCSYFFRVLLLISNHMIFRVQFGINKHYELVQKIVNCNLFTHRVLRSLYELVETCPCVPWSNWNLKVLVFKERGKSEYPEKNLSEQGKRTNNKLNPHMASTSGFEPGPHWWEESALTITPALHRALLLVLKNLLVLIYSKLHSKSCDYLYIKNWNPVFLGSKCFEISKFVFLSEVAHRSFCIKFSGLINL